MIFIQRDGEPTVINGNITFEEYMNEGFEGTHPTLDDYELQANLCFPEVRLRNFIEIRNHDCVGGDLKYSILAIYKGIFYDNEAMCECEELLKHLQYKDFYELRYNVPKQGLQTKIKNAKVLDYSKSIIQIAEKYLKLSQTGENIFLNPIKEFVNKGNSPADIISKKWHSRWNKNLYKLINYLEDLENFD